MDEEKKNEVPSSADSEKEEKKVQNQDQEVKEETPKVENEESKETSKDKEKSKEEPKKEDSKKKEKKEKVKKVKEPKPKKEKTPEEKKKSKKRAIISIVIVIIAIVVGVVLGVVYALFFSRIKIDLTKYVSLNTEGAYNGFAEFTTDDLVIDEKGLKKALDSKKLAEKLEKRLLNKAEVTENSDVKNGDEIEVKFKVSEDFQKENKIKINSEKIKIKVSDLEDPNELDLFKDIEISYSGISPNLTANLKNNSDNEFIKYDVKYTIQKAGSSNSSSYSLNNIANGDELKVTATYSDDELKKAGYVVKETEKTYKVENEAKYVTTADDLTDDVKNTIKDKLLTKAKSIANSSNSDVYYAYSSDFTSYSWDYNFTHTDPELVKLVLAVNTSDDSYNYTHNTIYAIYKSTYTDTSTSKTYDYYIAVDVDNIAVDKDGLYSSTNYYYEEFNNYSYTPSTGKSENTSLDELYNSIKDKTGTTMSLTEIN